MNIKKVSHFIKPKPKIKNLKFKKPLKNSIENYSNFINTIKSTLSTHNYICSAKKLTKSSVNKTDGNKTKKPIIFGKKNTTNKKNYICLRNYDSYNINSYNINSNQKNTTNSSIEKNDLKIKLNKFQRIKNKNAFISYNNNLTISRYHIKNNTLSSLRSFSKKNNYSHPKKNFESSFKIPKFSKNNMIIGSFPNKKINFFKNKINPLKSRLIKDKNCNSKNKKYMKILFKPKLFSQYGNSIKLIKILGHKKLITDRPTLCINTKKNISKLNINKISTKKILTTRNIKSKLNNYKKIRSKTPLSSLRDLFKNSFNDNYKTYLLTKLLNHKHVNFCESNQSSDDKESKMINYELDKLNEQSELSISSLSSIKKKELEKTISQINKEAKDYLNTSN